MHASAKVLYVYALVYIDFSVGHAQQWSTRTRKTKKENSSKNAHERRNAETSMRSSAPRGRAVRSYDRSPGRDDFQHRSQPQRHSKANQESENAPSGWAVSQESEKVPSGWAVSQEPAAKVPTGWSASTESEAKVPTGWAASTESEAPTSLDWSEKVEPAQGGWGQAENNSSSQAKTTGRATDTAETKKPVAKRPAKTPANNKNTSWAQVARPEVPLPDPKPVNTQRSDRSPQRRNKSPERSVNDVGKDQVSHSEKVSVPISLAEEPTVPQGLGVSRGPSPARQQENAAFAQTVKFGSLSLNDDAELQPRTNVQNVQAKTGQRSPQFASSAQAANDVQQGGLPTAYSSYQQPIPPTNPMDFANLYAQQSVDPRNSNDTTSAVLPGNAPPGYATMTQAMYAAYYPYAAYVNQMAAANMYGNQAGLPGFNQQQAGFAAMNKFPLYAGGTPTTNGPSSGSAGMKIQQAPHPQTPQGFGGYYGMPAENASDNSSGKGYMKQSDYNQLQKSGVSDSKYAQQNQQPHTQHPQLHTMPPNAGNAYYNQFMHQGGAFPNFMAASGAGPNINNGVYPTSGSVQMPQQHQQQQQNQHQQNNHQQQQQQQSGSSGVNANNNASRSQYWGGNI